MRAFVTGATGQLGSYLTRELLNQGHQVAVLVRDPAKAWRILDILHRCQVVVGSLEDAASVAPAVTTWRPDTCFHLAWFGVTADFRNDPRQVSVNAAGSIALLEALAKAGCGSFIGVGSQAEYGIVDGVLTENLPTTPVTAYGATKLAVGSLSKTYCELAGMRWSWLRLLATYGPADDENHLIPFVIGKLLSRERPSLTQAEQRWDYLHVQDAARALCLVGEHHDAAGIMNLGTGDPRPVSWIVERLRDLVDPTLPLGIGDLPYRPDQVMHLEADISRLAAAVGWRPEISWEDGLSETVAWYRSRRESV